MSIGTSIGAHFEDAFDHQAGVPYARDDNVVTPDQADQNKQLEQQDYDVMGGIQVGLKKVFITGHDDPQDYTKNFNTALTPSEQKDYDSKFSPKDSYDYDMQGWYKANPDTSPNTEGVHYPDTFKKPNHPTFSDQSQYSGDNGFQGGTWGKEDGRDTFTPGPTNMDMHGEGLRDYFNKVEPNAKLNMSNIEDRRSENYGGTYRPDGSVAWENIPPTLRDLGTSVGNQLFGTPQIPEAADSKLSDELGKRDIKLEPRLDRSLLARGIDDVQQAFNQFGIGKGKSWADILTDEDGSTSSRMPVGGSVEPAGALKSTEGTDPTSRLSILNSIHGMTNPSFDEDKKLLSGFYDTVKNAFKLPGEVYGGKIDPSSQQGIERAADLASLMVAGPAPVAAKMADGTLGSFAGVTAKTLDRAKLGEAQGMAHSGAHADDIWQKTGHFQGADGKWRFEIPDAGSSLKESGFNRIPEKPDVGWTQIGSPDKIVPKNPLKDADMSKMGIIEQIQHLTNSETHQPLSAVLDHPELYKTYPWLKDVKISELHGKSNDMGLAGPNYIKLSAMEPDKMHSILLHEVQHQIQQREGFARGGSPSEFQHPNLSKADKIYEEAVKSGGDPASPALTKARRLLEDLHIKAWEEYRKVAGEVEARNVQARMDMIRLERKYQSPESTERVPRSEQIIKHY